MYKYLKNTRKAGEIKFFFISLRAATCRHKWEKDSKLHSLKHQRSADFSRKK